MATSALRRAGIAKMASATRPTGPVRVVCVGTMATGVVCDVVRIVPTENAKDPVVLARRVVVRAFILTSAPKSVQKAVMADASRRLDGVLKPAKMDCSGISVIKHVRSIVNVRNVTKADYVLVDVKMGTLVQNVNNLVQ